MSGVLGGCTQFHETYYVGIYNPTPPEPAGENAVNSDPQETQLYKYDISGSSFGSTTQFASGLYDSRVVDRLFGEIRPATASAPVSTTKPASAPKTHKPGRKPQRPKQRPTTKPAPATTVPLNSIADADQSAVQDATAESADFTTADPHRRIFVKFGPEGAAVAQSDSERMVIFMSSDPQALTDRISAMANAQQTQATIAKVISKPHSDEQALAIQNVEDDVAAARKTVATYLEQVSASESDPEIVKLCAKQLIQSLRPSR